MKALIVNDDGVDAVGIQTLARVALEAGLEITVAAPHTEHSGASSSLSALAEDGRLVTHARTWDGFGGIKVLGVEASPALIAFVAARGAFGPAPDLVLSGVNHGPNTGHAILHSGTVGAALTASLHNAAAVAFSLASGHAENFDTAAMIARPAIDWMIQHGKPGWALNINIPDIPAGRCRGLRSATLASFGAVQAEIGEVDEGYVTVTFAEERSAADPGTDVALLHEGWATATILRAPYQDTEVDLAELVEQ